ncbi:hypothetical protein DPMN_023190 [Dreissena polymorpha]|uniref:Uncharacterized protein n=1 Tax=Dreissena polymorpha TaxID=45954 RepID=A0A9D4RBI8_DREPO|nr:hypothetical protein DPMN_023190 [Dreissena polymorpha]
MPHSTYVTLHTPIKPLPAQRFFHPQKKHTQPEQLTHRPQKQLAHRRLYPRRNHHNAIALSSTSHYMDAVTARPASCLTYLKSFVPIHSRRSIVLPNVDVANPRS